MTLSCSHLFASGFRILVRSLLALCLRTPFLSYSFTQDGSREQRALHMALSALAEGEDYLVYDGQKDEPFMHDWQMSALPKPMPYALKMCYLDPRHFPNGGLFFKDVAKFRRVHNGEVPIIVHANYMKV